MSKVRIWSYPRNPKTKHKAIKVFFKYYFETSLKTRFIDCGFHAMSDIGKFVNLRNKSVTYKSYRVVNKFFEEMRTISLTKRMYRNSDEFSVRSELSV